MPHSTPIQRLTPKAWATKFLKEDKLDFTEIKNIFHQKNFNQKNKKISCKIWENICKSISNKYSD